MTVSNATLNPSTQLRIPQKFPTSPLKSEKNLKFVHDTRLWRKSQSGRWFPEKSENYGRMGSEAATPFFHYTLTISECGPLDRPSISTTPSMTVFGPLPEGVLIGTRDANGKMVLNDVSAARPPEFEDQLRQQADKIRGTGFSAGRAK